MKKNQPNNTWTEKEERILRKHYPDTNNEDLTLFVDRSQNAIMHKASRLGLRKSAKFMASPKSGRFTPEKNFFKRLKDLWLWANG